MEGQKSVNKRFVKKNDKDRQDILDERVKKSTQNATKVWLNVISSYMKEKEIGVCIDEVTTEDLPNFLFEFYSEVRRDDGTIYSNTSLKAM